MQLGVGLGLPYTLGKPAAAFSPLDLSPVLWLDASDTSTITEVGGAVSQWDDKSGNGNHVTQATAAYQPKSNTATLNSLNVIEYDNTTGFQHLFNLSIDFSTGTHTFFMVVNIAASDTAHALLASGQTFGGYAYLAQSGSTSTTINSWTSTSLHVDAVVFSGSTRNDVYQHVGTGPKLVRIVSQANVSGFTIGYGQDPFDWDYGTTMAEMIAIGGTLTAGQIAATETYLADKWGITL